MLHGSCAQAAGLVSDPASQVLSPEVDVVAALRAQILGLVAKMKTASARAKTEMDTLQAELPKLDDSYGVPDGMLLPLWEESLQAAGGNLGVLNEKTGEISEGFDKQVAASEALLAGLESLIVLQQAQAEKATALESTLLGLTSSMLDAANQAPVMTIGDITPPPPPEQADEQLCVYRSDGVAMFGFSLLAGELLLQPSPPPPPLKSPPPVVSPPPSAPPASPPAWWAIPPPPSLQASEQEEASGAGGRKLLKARSSGPVAEEAVVEEAFLGYTIPEATDIFRQEAEFTMERFVSLKNKLVAGIELTVYNRRNSTCTKRFGGIGASCNLGAAMDGRYGMDPVFYDHADLYRPELEDKVERYYNASVPESEEVDCMVTDPFDVQSCKPNPFDHPHSQAFPDGSPVYLDAGVTGYRFREVFTLMREGGYISSNAERLEMEMVTFNAHLQIFSLVKMVWRSTHGGSFVPTTEIQLIAMRRWPAQWTMPKNADEFDAALMMGLYAVWAMIIFTKVYNDLRKRVKGMGKVPRAERSVPELLTAFFKHERRLNVVWSLVDLGAIWLQFACLFVFVYKEYICWTEVSKIQVCPPVQ
jgi:hypothetical protein